MSTDSRASVVDAALAKNRLGTSSLMQFVLTAAAPMLVVAGLVTAGYATGIVAIPIAFIILGAAFGLFCVGYMAMSRQVVNAGSLYAYVAHGLGRPAGVAAASLALWSYNLLQVGLYGIFGVLASGLLQEQAGRSVPWWACALVAWAITAVLGLRAVDVIGRILMVLLTAELLIVGVIDGIALTHPAGGHIQLDALDPGGLLVPGAAAALAIAATGFIGFEQAPVYAEESRRPRRTVPIATYVALGLMILVYAGSSFAMTVAVGPDQIVEQAREQSVGLLFGIGAPVLGSGLTVGAQGLFLTSILAGCISYHAAVSRYAYAIGREGVLPRVLARTALRTGAPVAASIAQSFLGLIVIVVVAVMGWDPLVHLFFWCGTAGGVGVLLLVAAASVSIVVYFARNDHAEGLWRTAIAPATAAIALLAAAYLVLSNVATLLGVDPASPWATIWPLSYAIIAGLGLLWGVIMRVTGHPAYPRIGRGATTSMVDAVTTTQPAGALR